jgi:hypothetical protein
MDMFRLCRRWLFAMCVVSVVIGALLVVAGASSLMSAYNANVVAAFGLPALAGGALAQHQWALGVTGAGTMGWAVTLAFVVAIPFARREAWAWWCITSSVALWIAVDVALSLYWGVTAEVLFASGAGVGFAVPLALTRGHFGRGARSSSIANASKV